MKKTANKFVSVVMAILLSLLVALPSYAAQSRDISTEFVQTSKEEYVQYVAKKEGISEEQVLARIESKWAETRNQYGVAGETGIVPYGFDFGHSEVRDGWYYTSLRFR